MMTVPNNQNKFQGLLKAVESNNAPMIRQWIKLGAPLPDDESLISRALSSAQDAAVTALFDAGAVKASNAEAAVNTAVTFDRIEFGKRAFKEHVDNLPHDKIALTMINAADPFGLTPARMEMLEYVLKKGHVQGKQGLLDVAVAKGNLEAAIMLVEAGAPVSEWLATQVKTPGIIGPLVRMGMDLHVKNDDGDTPIMFYAAQTAAGNASLISEAIGVGADPMVVNKAGESLLDRFLTSNYPAIATAGEVLFAGPEEERALVARLLDMEVGVAAVEKRDGDKMSRLRLGLIFGATKTIEQEMRRHGMGATIRRTNNSAKLLSPMQVTVHANSGEAIRTLHALGMDLEAGDRQTSRPALVTAVTNNCGRAVAALLACGADHKVKISEAASLLAYAAQRGYDEIARLLRGAETGTQIVHALDDGLELKQTKERPRTTREMTAL